MEPLPPEPAKMDDRAYRVRSIIIILMVVLMGAPLVVYLLSGRGAVAR